MLEQFKRAKIQIISEIEHTTDTKNLLVSLSTTYSV